MHRNDQPTTLAPWIVAQIGGGMLALLTTAAVVAAAQILAQWLALES